jgi:serine/threonine protein phosphatase PrpC
MSARRSSSIESERAHQAEPSTRVIRFAGATDRGRRRQRNEDAVLTLPEHALALVADGMGGHANGDVASQMAIDTVATFFLRVVGWDGTGHEDDEVSASEHCLTSAMRLANWRLYYGAEPDPNTGIGMGSTLVAALFGNAGRTVTIGHIGDSRAYRLRAAQLERLTDDHSAREELLRADVNEAAMAVIPQHILTRALGVHPDVDVDILHDQTLPGDVYLLCSDGLWAKVSEDEILATLTAVRSLDVACGALIALANQHGGGDNISVALARVDEIAAPRRSDVLPR